MSACWQENPLNRPSFIQLQAEFDSMLAKQRNASELYIELQTEGAELQPCHESEVAKFIDSKAMEEAASEQENTQKLHFEDDGEDSGSTCYVDSPKRDDESRKQSLQSVLDDATLPDVRFLSSPTEVAYNLERGSPFLPEFFSLHSTSNPEEIVDEFQAFGNN